MRPRLKTAFFIFFAVFFLAHFAHAATNVYYSVGQSTSTNLETGSPTVTIASGTATFSVAQTGNIGVGDQVTYGASSSVAYISGKANVNELIWTLVTATGTTPANITNATVTSINRAFSSLSGAMTNFSNATHLGTSTLIGANAILNLPCYYDTGPDTSPVNMGAIALTTGLSNYVNIYTPNNTSTQANFSQRHMGKWTSNAYQLSVTGGTYVINLTASRDDIHIAGLQIELTTTSTAPEDIRMDAIVDAAGYVVFDGQHYRDGCPVEQHCGMVCEGLPATDKLYYGGDE